jgi:FKBP-type peptidyl-prolyl cis-trans isomerase
MLRRLLIIGVVLALALAAFAGCGGDSDTSDSISFEPFDLEAPKSPIRREKDLKPAANGLVGSELKPIIPDRPPPEFLVTQDLVDGIGRLGREGDRVTVQYVGYRYDSKEKFASSWDEGKPFSFILGSGEAIDGWEEGVEAMEVSDRRELVIPPDLTGGGSKMKDVPSDEALVYVVELLDVEYNATPAETSSGKKKSKPKVTVPQGAPPKKLAVEDLEEGTGPAIKAGDEITVQYVGVDYKTGQQFDASWDRGEPLTFLLGSGQVIPGWDQGLEGMKVGGRRELIIPPSLAYGAQGSGPIAPNSTLVFVVDLLAVK